MNLIVANGIKRIRGSEIANAQSAKAIILAKKFNTPQLRLNYHLLLALPILFNKTCPASETLEGKKAPISCH
jgi:hypothetical protein